MSWNLEQAANDLERYVLRGELPAIDACKVLIDNARTERTCRYESTNRCTWVCTSCSREVDVLHYGYNYCPNCGAKVIEK